MCDLSLDYYNMSIYYNKASRYKRTKIWDTTFIWVRDSDLLHTHHVILIY